MVNNIMTLKSGLRITPSHWKWHHSLDCIQVPSHWRSTLTMALSCIIYEIKWNIGQNPQFFIPDGHHLQFCIRRSCSVVFGITSKLLVINISSSFPAINKHAAYYQRSVTTCRTVVWWHHIDNTWPVAVLTARMKLDIGSESWFLPTPSAFDVPVGGGVPVGILPCHLVWKN